MLDDYVGELSRGHHSHRPGQEGRHLRPGHRLGGTVPLGLRSASGCHVGGGEGAYVTGVHAAGDVGEPGGAGWIEAERPDQEGGHLPAGHPPVGAEPVGFR